MLAPPIQLGKDGPDYSRVVFGCWRLADWHLAPVDRLRLVEQALELGITTMDHADIYGDYMGEALFGEALALAPGLRQRLQIVSKCGIKLVSANRPQHRIKHYDTSRAHIVASVENSLRQLRTDYLDLVLLHRPDPLMDADEVAEAFTVLQQAGKVRQFGVSNFTPAQFDLLASRVPLVTNQVELSVLHTQALHDGTLDQCQRLSIKPMAWSALGGGRLFNDTDSAAARLRAVLAEIADRHEVTPTVIAYAWVLQLPSHPMVLTGSRHIRAAEEAVRATRLALSREEWFAVLRASSGMEVA